jgi:hypothetical protein
MLDYTVELINNRAQLEAALARWHAAQAFALDIETTNWWDRHAERIALVQLAYREAEHTHVAVIDALAEFDLEPLREPLELSWQTKAIHNASFDAVRLVRHLQIATAPIHDTMRAARRNGERRCSLQAQAAAHLGIDLNKDDWSRRPLRTEQLDYAARDAVCTLLLYEQQCARGLRGDYELRARSEQLPVLPQAQLPLLDDEPRLVITPPVAVAAPQSPTEFSPAGFALLGIITELSGRYSPDQLAVSVGSERVGLAGWIIDRVLGDDADIDEASARQEIAQLCEGGLASLSFTRRLEATTAGTQLWRAHKP